MSGIPASYTVPSSSGSTETVKPYDLASSILVSLGVYFQIQDDFLDYSGTPEQIGKIGTDIVDNKCSWCINTALRLASPAQRETLDANYGRKDKTCEDRIKQIYEELGVRKVYAEYEERAVGELRAKISTIVEVPNGLRKEVFESFLGKIYQRTK